MEHAAKQNTTTTAPKKQGNFFGKKSEPSFFSPALIQPRLTIGPVDDPYEREADAIADKVMRMSDTETLQTKPSPVTIQRKCAACEEEKLKRKCEHCEEEEKLQMKGEPGAGGMAAPSIVHDVINSGGQSLDTGTRYFMESRFGYDFGNVQVHNDSMANKSSADINALAYTHGNHVVFGAGQYQPGTNNGKQLLAHELTHVVQQDTGKSNTLGDVMRTEKPENEFENCKDPELKLLLPVIDKARRAVIEATGIVGSAFGRPDKVTTINKKLLTDHFHTTSHDDLRDILSKYISIGKSFAAGLELKCETSCPKSTKGAFCGYADRSQWAGGYGPIHICFDKTGCDFLALNKKNQIATIIHEAAHRHTGVDDKAYIWEATYKTQSSDDAMDNADSYAGFATLLYLLK